VAFLVFSVVPFSLSVANAASLYGMSLQGRTGRTGRDLRSQRGGALSDVFSLATFVGFSQPLGEVVLARPYILAPLASHDA
jgi:hypothetical protein